MRGLNRPLFIFMKKKLYYKITLLCFLILFPFLLFMLPANYFDNGNSVCLSQYLAGKECFGCGMTRGIMHLIHLDIEEAFAYNMLSFIVLPLLAVIWIQWIVKELKICILLKNKMNLAKENTIIEI